MANPESRFFNNGADDQKVTNKQKKAMKAEQIANKVKAKKAKRNQVIEREVQDTESK